MSARRVWRGQELLTNELLRRGCRAPLSRSGETLAWTQGLRRLDHTTRSRVAIRALLLGLVRWSELKDVYDAALH